MLWQAEWKRWVVRCDDGRLSEVEDARSSIDASKPNRFASVLVLLDDEFRILRLIVKASIKLAGERKRQSYVWDCASLQWSGVYGTGTLQVVATPKRM